MATREYPATFHCAQPGGCRESITYRYETRRDETDGRRRNRDHPWKCSRHRDPDAYLRPGNEQARQVLIATRLRSGDDWLSGLYWCPEGASSGSGQVSGPGFIARTGEFPAGTRLVVTAQVEMPGDGEHKGESNA